MSENIRLAGIVGDSITDGVGLRMTIFTQGCPHNCKGCHNPETHDFNSGYEITPADLINKIDSSHIITGVTFSGGEPMCQAKALLPIARYVKERGLHLAIYSGFTFDQLLTMGEDVINLLRLTDVLVDGKFDISKKSMNLKFMGSTNQRPIDVQASLNQNKVVIDASWL